jgi:hypothetical protein
MYTMESCICALDCFATCLTCWTQCGEAGDAACIRCGCAGAAPAVAGAAPVVVISAPSEYERRAVAWLYHHNEAPDLADWRDCLARFELENVPVHVLAGPHRVVEVRIDVNEGLFSATDIQVAGGAGGAGSAGSAGGAGGAGSAGSAGGAGSAGTALPAPPAPPAPPVPQRITLGSLAARRLLAAPKTRIQFSQTLQPTNEGTKLIGDPPTQYV